MSDDKAVPSLARLQQMLYHVVLLKQGNMAIQDGQLCFLYAGSMYILCFRFVSVSSM